MARTKKRYLGGGWPVLLTLAAAVLGMFLVSGCASFKGTFKTGPMWTPLAPPRSDVVMVPGSSIVDRLTVVVYPGDGQPYCSGPDAANEVKCEFRWEWLQTGSMTSLGNDGWRSLTPQGARAACNAGLFTIGTRKTTQHVNICAYLLMSVRHMDLPPDNTPPERQ